MAAEPVVIRVFAAPMAACGGSGQTWALAAATLGQRLERRFGQMVSTEFVELFSPRSFEFPGVLARIEAGGPLPLVTIGDDVITEGGKLSEPLIARALVERGLAAR